MSSLCACNPPANLQRLLDYLPPPTRGPTLAKLYETAWTTIPAQILARDTPHLTQTELCQVLDFKLSFGQNRPALRGMINALQDTEVKAASEKSFQLISDSAKDINAIMKSIKALTVLRGIGPATASLILSLISPDTPFFSDEAAVKVLQPTGGRRGLKYTEAEYKKFLGLVRQKAGSGSAREWERRVWVEESTRGLGLDVVLDGDHGKGAKRKADALGEGDEVDKAKRASPPRQVRRGKRNAETP